MRYTLPIILSLVFWTQAFTQHSNFSIADYARPTLERRTANVEFNLSSLGSSNLVSEQNSSTGINLRSSFLQSKFVNNNSLQITASNSGKFSWEQASTVFAPVALDGSTQYTLNLERTYSRKKFDEQERFW